MKKSILSVLSITGIALLLAACQGNNPSPSSEASSEPAPTSKISLYKGNSLFCFVSARGMGSSPLATYRHADLGEAPYVELEQYVNVLSENTIIAGAKYEKLADHLYGISQNGATVMTLNPETDQLIVKNLDFANLMGNVRNHDIGQDPAGSSDLPENAVHGSAKTKLIGTLNDEVIDMAKYNFDMVESQGKLYFPYQPVSSVIARNSAFDFLYNGSDFYIGSTLSAPLSNLMPGAAVSCYATEGKFIFADALYVKVDPVGEEKYRFYAESDGKAFSFKKDGVVELLQVASKTDAGTPVASGFTLSYEEEQEGLYIKFASNINEQYISVAKIPNSKTYFDAKERPVSVAQHSLDILRFQFDNLYGLKEELFKKTGATSFDGLIDKLNLRQRLLSSDSMVYDEALCEFLMGTVDDAHTTYNMRSIFSGLPKAGVKEMASAKTGPRRGGLFEKMSAYSELRKQSLPEGANPHGLFFSGETAVIRFDQFAEGAGKVLNSKGGWAPTTDDIGASFATSTTEGMYLSVQEIKKHSEVKNVVVDLTVNGGGAVLTLPYLAALWTDDPHIMVKEIGAGIVKDYHYDVDFNRNGIFGEPEDTLKGQYEFFVLTSDFSFSCGNSYPTIAYADGVKVIGKQSGGGACPVSSMCDGSGTIYNSSMPRYFVYPDGKGGYINNDSGIPIKSGYELNSDSWYDLAKLNIFCNGLRGN